jgi:hypothetical protein
VISSKIKTYTLSAEEKESILTNVANVLQQQPEIDFAYAYGSFLDSKPFRDLDIALFLNSKQLPKKIHAYETDIERFLSKSLHKDFPIEVRILNNASIPLLKGVIQGRLLIDNDPLRRIDFATTVISRYLDIEPVLRHYAREAYADEIKP